MLVPTHGACLVVSTRMSFFFFFKYWTELCWSRVHMVAFSSSSSNDLIGEKILGLRLSQRERLTDGGVHPLLSQGGKLGHCGVTLIQ